IYIALFVQRNEAGQKGPGVLFRKLRFEQNLVDGEYRLWDRSVPVPDDVRLKVQADWGLGRLTRSVQAEARTALDCRVATDVDHPSRDILGLKRNSHHGAVRGNPVFERSTTAGRTIPTHGSA